MSAHPAQMLPGGRPPAPAPTPEADRGRGAAAGGMLPYLARVVDGFEVWAHHRKAGSAVECAGYLIVPQGEPLDCRGLRKAKAYRDALRIATEMGARR